jgi:hypothetical protein
MKLWALLIASLVLSAGVLACTVNNDPTTTDPPVQAEGE